MQQTIFSILKQDYKITKPIRLIEMFAGIGSQAKALKNLSKDFVNYKLIEIDNYCILSYNAIHGTNFHPQDITKIKGEDLEIVEKDKYEYVLTYSFPCTDVSLAGKRQGMAKDSGTRSALLWEVERIMKELKELNQLPQILLMENVPQVINNDFNEWQSFLDSIGYSNYTEILNAKDYGIPQNRNRCFMVSILGDYNYLFPPKQKLELRLKDFLEDEVDKKYYLSEKMVNFFVNNSKKNKDKGNGFKFSPFLSKEVIAKTITTNNGSRMDDNFIAEFTIFQKPHGYNKGGTYKECPSITTTINTMGGGNCIRKLTPKECWRLMGFSDKDYEKASKVCSNTQLYKQAGNSIVVNVLMEIFRRFYD